MSKLPYNKPDTTKQGKILSRGGPRDMQRRQNATQVIVQAPSVNPDDIAELKELSKLLKDNIQRESIIKDDVEGKGLTYDEIRKKIMEAVQLTKEEEKKRYESGLKSLTSQLNAANEKIKLLQIEIDKRDTRILELSKNGYSSNEELKELRLTVDKLINSFNGKIPVDVNVDISRPVIEDKVFINLTDNDRTFDSFIDIKPEQSEQTDTDKNVNTQIAKLRELLKNKDRITQEDFGDE